MRAAAAGLALGLLLVASGCGSSTAATSGLGMEAAALVPANALAFVSADANLDSSEWRVLVDLTGGLKDLTQGIDYKRDVHPAVGDEVNLAVLGVDNGKPEAIALVHPQDAAKLRALAARFDRGTEHYTVEQIGGWSVVADSQGSFDAVRAAASGRSLADTTEFKNATAQLASGGLARAYANAAALQKLPGRLSALARLAGSPRWLAARLAADSRAVQVDVRVGSPASARANYKPALLRDVPSGAIAALSFKDVNRLLARLAAEPALRKMVRQAETSLGLRLADLKALDGEGVLYVAPSAIVPIITLELLPSNPKAAAKALRAVATRAGRTLPVHVERRSAKVLLTNAPAGYSAGARSLVDDQPFKDALAAADVPAEVQWLAYADVQRLLPILQAIAALRSGGQGQPQAKTPPALDKLGTAVAFGARTGSTSLLKLRLGLR
jgi:hypothetical protein